MPRCFECGHEAEYVGLSKVENCSNPDCRYHGVGQVLVQKAEPVPVTLAVDVTTGGAAAVQYDGVQLHTPDHERPDEIVADEVHHIRAKRLPKPAPPLQPAKTCASCWALSSEPLGCRKYPGRDLSPGNVMLVTCDNHEFPPQDDRAGDLKLHVLKQRAAPMYEFKMMDHIQILDPLDRDPFKKEIQAKFNGLEHTRVFSPAMFRPGASADKTCARVTVRFRKRRPERDHGAILLTPEDIIWAGPPGYNRRFRVDQKVFLFDGADRDKTSVDVMLVAVSPGCDGNIPVGTKMGFCERRLSQMLDIECIEAGAGGSD